jgi:hypothetical protein
MWNCTTCNRSFKNFEQIHNCSDKAVSDFLVGKSDVAIELFNRLIEKFEEIGPINLYATKTMIVIAAELKFAYIINIGKAFVDIVLPFKELHKENLCFRKIALVPGSNDYNHHLRLMFTEDINEEVFDYMKKAYANGKSL